MDIKPAPDVPGVKDCCKDVDSHEITEKREPFLVTRCKVCKCRHFRLYALPGVMGVVGKGLGR